MDVDRAGFAGDYHFVVCQYRPVAGDRCEDLLQCDELLQPVEELQFCRVYRAGGAGPGLFLFIPGLVPTDRLTDPVTQYRVVYYHCYHWVAVADFCAES